MEYKNLIYEEKGDVGILTINRPKKLNALNTKTNQEIEAALNDIKTNSSIRALILTGTGDKAFVAGADISELT